MSLPMDTHLASIAPSSSSLPVSAGDASIDQITQARVIVKAVTYEGTIEESEGYEWKDTSDEECDEHSDTVKSSEEISFPRAKPKVISRHSLLIERIHEKDGRSTMQNVASFSSPESRRPQTSNDSRALSSSNTRRKMISQEMINTVRQALLWERQPRVTLSNESREDIDANFLVSS